MTEGRHVVFWSGGQDSTLVAVQLLRSGKFVNLISFDNCVIGGEHQQNLEKLYRKRILERFRAEFGENSFKHTSCTWDSEFTGGTQDVMWVSFFPLLCKDGDTAYYGNVRIDDFWHYRAEFEKTFNQICEYQKKKVKIEYPLEWLFKKEVIKRLKKYGYFDLTIHSGDKL